MKKIKKNITGKEYWRSLDQLADTPEFREFLHREFPENASELGGNFSRRKFLTLMGASIALAGLASCRRPVEKIVPYVKAPEEIIPGVPKYYSTTIPMPMGGLGIVVESHEGRPTKIEGNSKHPVTFGKSTARMQAEILNLYDPDRSQTVLKGGRRAKWKHFVSFWEKKYEEFAANGGDGLAVLSGAFSSPTQYRLYEEFKKTFPKAVWAVYEPVSDENIIEGARIAAGKNVRPVYHYDKANVILSVDSDFLGTENGVIAATNQFAKGRRVETEHDSMNRLYVVEPTFTVTGGMSDHRMRLPLSRIDVFLFKLAAELQNQGLPISLPGKFSGSIDEKWVAALARDLVANKGKSLIVVGKRQPAAVHALALSINEVLGNIGQTVSFREIKDTLLPDSGSLKALVKNIDDKKITTLVMLGGNPVYNCPADVNFSNALTNVETVIHLSSHADETSSLADWHIPELHFLESWSDVRAEDGTLSVVQPLIEPLFGGSTVIEMLALLGSGKESKSYDEVRKTWSALMPGSNFEDNWRQVLHDGVLENSAFPEVKLSVNSEAVSEAVKQTPAKSNDMSPQNMEVIFSESYALFDGRLANNGWLQEFPHPVTKVAWDNIILISPKTAQDTGVKTADLVYLTLNGRQIKAPVFILPGQADNCLTIDLGYGRTKAGRVGSGVGFNAYRLRTSDNLWSEEGAAIVKTGETYLLANTQDHWSLEGRPLLREATLEHYKEHPDFAPEMVEHPPLKSLWEEPKYDKGYQWGMSIDLNACSGCNACVVACQSENNIPVVGKEQVAKGREMQWIRLDRYFSGDINDPEMVYQPVACVQCEMAPCESVCPVAATTHNEEGLNVMAYNRCIGTRYCSNNCPYKVRRFNFFNYTKDYPEIIKLAQNPDVTVRARGVMEKCTYCTQRIEEARIKSQNAGVELKDGDVVTACQQSCPADAIVFGNILDKNSRVSKVKEQNRDYAMLGELNLKPRTTYLAKLRNPNPEIEKSENII